MPSLPSCFNGRAPDESALPDNKTAGRAAALSKVFHLRETVCCRGSHRTGTVSTAAALPAGGWPRLLEHQRRQSVNSKAPAASACVSGDDILRVSDGHESRVAPRDKKLGYCHRARGGQQQHSTHTHTRRGSEASEQHGPRVKRSSISLLTSQHCRAAAATTTTRLNTAQTH